MVAPYRRPRARRRLELGQPMNAARAAIAIQAAARGMLARRRLARVGGVVGARLVNRAMDRREQRQRRALMSPMDIQRRFRRAQRPQGQVRVPKIFPSARIGSKIGTEVSKRPVSLRKIDPSEVKLHIDTKSTVSQSGVAYFGFPDAGSQDEQLKQGCIALVNMFFRRSGLKMATIKTKVRDAYSHIPDNNPEYSDCKLRRISILFVRNTAGGNGFYVNVTFDMDNSKSIEDMALLIYNQIKLKSAGTDDGVDGEGAWPLIAKLWSRDSDDSTAHQYANYATYDLANVMVDFKFMRKYKWQNITPSGNAGTGAADRSTINDIMANPLSGRIYKFKGPTPLVRRVVEDQQSETMPQILAIQYQGAGTLAHDYLDTRAFRMDTPGGPSFDAALAVPFKQPFKAASVFRNTETEDKVYMPPGGYKQIIRSEKVTMNFIRFCRATVFDSGAYLQKPGYNQPKISKIGTSTLFALEPAVRTVPNEAIKVMVNSEIWYTTKCRVGDKKQPVMSNVKVEEGFNFEEED